MSTFARVKQLSYISRGLLLVAILLTAVFDVASAQRRAAVDDSIEVGLVTCQPGQKVYSLYGHTAIRYHDLRTGDDWVFNYGVFDVHKPHFILRFVFGLTDYELGVLPMDVFRSEYVREGREVWEQVLNMTTEEKRRLWDALDDNYKPENRVYRYNYFYDNCTTRARDMIEKSLGGRLKYGYETAQKDGASYRELIHEKAQQHPWAAFGNDMCLGVKADLHTDWREREFLPGDMMADMEKAYVEDGGKRYPAVLETRTIVNGAAQIVESEFPLLPRTCALLLLALTVVVSTVEWKSGRWLRFYDVLLMTAQALVGIILMALLFSEHPTTSTNLQVLLFNPLPLVFVYSVVRGKHTVWWPLSVVLSLLFIIGGLAQCYAEGMVIVALSLLVRSVLGCRRQRTRRVRSLA